MTRDKTSLDRLGTIECPGNTHGAGSARRLGGRIGTIIGLLAIIAATPALAQSVPVCSGLTLYANAANEGLCKSLTPTTQNHWVCQLAYGPDIHLTFNNATARHITVRTHSCEGQAYLTGTFPRSLALRPGTPQTLCRVDVANYVSRLNAVDRLPPAPFVVTAINAAVGGNRLTVGVGHTYLSTARHAVCP